MNTLSIDHQQNKIELLVNALKESLIGLQNFNFYSTDTALITKIKAAIEAATK